MEWVAISYSRGSSRPRNQTQVSYLSCIGRQVLYHYHHPGSQHVPWNLAILTFREREKNPREILSATWNIFVGDKRQELRSADDGREVGPQRDDPSSLSAHYWGLWRDVGLSVLTLGGSQAKWEYLAKISFWVWRLSTLGSGEESSG